MEETLEIANTRESPSLNHLPLLLLLLLLLLLCYLLLLLVLLLLLLLLLRLLLQRLFLFDFSCENKHIVSSIHLSSSSSFLSFSSSGPPPIPYTGIFPPPLSTRSFSPVRFHLALPIVLERERLASCFRKDDSNGRDDNSGVRFPRVLVEDEVGALRLLLLLFLLSLLPLRVPLNHWPFSYASSSSSNKPRDLACVVRTKEAEVS